MRQSHIFKTWITKSLTLRLTQLSTEKYRLPYLGHSLQLFVKIVIFLRVKSHQKSSKQSKKSLKVPTCSPLPPSPRALRRALRAPFPGPCGMARASPLSAFPVLRAPCRAPAQPRPVSRAPWENIRRRGPGMIYGGEGFHLWGNLCRFSSVFICFHDVPLWTEDDSCHRQLSRYSWGFTS